MVPAASDGEGIMLPKPMESMGTIKKTDSIFLRILFDILLFLTIFCLKFFTLLCFCV
mgnify:CR=1 FL=1